MASCANTGRGLVHCTRAKNRPRFERYLHNNIICIKLGTAQQTFQTGDSTAEDKYNNFNPIFFSFFSIICLTLTGM